MALTFVKRSTIPVSTKGKVGTMSVGIGANGQITFSTLISKALGTDMVAIAFDADTRSVQVYPKGHKATEKLPESEFFKLRKAKKGDTYSFSATNLLRMEDVFSTGLYDFKGSGNQSFPATYDEKKKIVTFTLPAGQVKPRPVTHRTKKAKTMVAGAGTSANPGEISGTANTPMEEEDLVLEPA